MHVELKLTDGAYRALSDSLKIHYVDWKRIEREQAGREVDGQQYDLLIDYAKRILRTRLQVGLGNNLHEAVIPETIPPEAKTLKL